MQKCMLSKICGIGFEPPVRIQKWGLSLQSPNPKIEFFHQIFQLFLGDYSVSIKYTVKYVLFVKYLDEKLLPEISVKKSSA